MMKILVRTFAVCLAVLSLTLSGCDFDDEIEIRECNNGDYAGVAWLRNEIAYLERVGDTDARIEVYEYQGQVMFFSIPSDSPIYPEPCVLYTCGGAEVCVLFPRDNINTCSDFANRGLYREDFWTN